MSWKRSYAVTATIYYCVDAYIIYRSPHGQYSGDYLECQYGCSGRIGKMSYACIGYSIDDDWTLGENYLKLTHDLLSLANTTVTVGFTGWRWVEPFLGYFNISTTFSLTIRKDTGQINSSPRVTSFPIIRLQEGCNHTIVLPVNDPDGDTIRCQWAESIECISVCNAFPGAELHSNSCTIQYEANMGTGNNIATIMLEDFLLGLQNPLVVLHSSLLLLCIHLMS